MCNSLSKRANVSARREKEPERVHEYLRSAVEESERVQREHVVGATRRMEEVLRRAIQAEAKARMLSIKVDSLTLQVKINEEQHASASRNAHSVLQKRVEKTTVDGHRAALKIFGERLQPHAHMSELEETLEASVRQPLGTENALLTRDKGFEALEEERHLQRQLQREGVDAATCKKGTGAGRGAGPEGVITSTQGTTRTVGFTKN